MDRGSLWRDPDFLKLWTGQTVSGLGSVVTRNALPLLALLVLGAGAAELAALTVARSLGVLLVGLVAGAWVDRLQRRPVLIATSVARSALLFLVPFAFIAGALQIQLLYVVAFLVASLGTLFGSASRAYLPSLIGIDRLLEANSRIATSEAIAEVGGPGFAGALIQVVSAPFAVLVDAISFLVSAVSLVLIRAPEPARPPRTTGGGALVREIGEGIAVVQRSGVVRALAGASVTEHFFGSFYAALYTLYLLNELHLSPLLIGIVVSAGGVGSLAGSVVAQRFSRRLGVGPTMIACSLAASAIGVLTPLATGPVVVATAMVFLPQLIGDALNTVKWIGSDTVVQATTPDRVLGRVSATIDVLSHGVAPLGAIVAALIAEPFGARTAIALGWLGMATEVLWLLFSPVRSLAIPVAAPAATPAASGGAD